MKFLGFRGLDGHMPAFEASGLSTIARHQLREAASLPPLMVAVVNNYDMVKRCLHLSFCPIQYFFGTVSHSHEMTEKEFMAPMHGSGQQLPRVTGSGTTLFPGERCGTP